MLTPALRDRLLRKDVGRSGSHSFPTMATSSSDPRSDETNRLRTLSAYELDTLAVERDLSQLVQLVARLLDAPMAMVSIVDQDRQRIQARCGDIRLRDDDRDVSFCSHALAEPELLVVPDTLKDARFWSNPYVLGEPFVRFYAGRPLVAFNGEVLGTLCVLDLRPRPGLTPAQQQSLFDIAGLVMSRMELRRLDRVRLADQARFESIATTAPDAIVCLDGQGRVSYWNAAAARVFGCSAAHVVGRPATGILDADSRAVYEERLARLQGGEPLDLAERTLEVTAQRADGSRFPAELSLSTWQDQGRPGVGMIVRDITERKKHEQRLTQLATTDTLTGLANRASWREHIQRALAEDARATVLLLDLDNFKEVNDGWGHSAGDAVLRDLAGRLQRVWPDARCIARLGGDEFVALFSGNAPDAARQQAASLLHELQAVPLFEALPDLGASIGIALAPEHGERPEELLGAADLTLYRAKAAGKGGIEVFTPDLRELAAAQRAFQQELRLAFERGEYELFYQPYVSLADLRVVGAEALLRWRHPTRGLLAPVAFIDVLSQKPSAALVGDWVMHTACRTAAQWQRLRPGFRIGVNLFPAQLKSGRLLAVAQQAVAQAGMPPECLELEIVENTLLGGDTSTFELLYDLRSAGFGLAFDDYGTGFASLSLLKRYPVNRLKIDRAFVRNASEDPADAAVVRTIQYLGDSFGMAVIAEGVETGEQLALLRSIGCPEAQGYLFGRPVPAEEFERLHLGG